MSRLNREWPDKYDCDWILQGLWEKIDAYCRELNIFRHDFDLRHANYLEQLAYDIVIECDKILRRYPANTDVGSSIIEIKDVALKIIEAGEEKFGPGSRRPIHTGQGYSLDRIPYEYQADDIFRREFINAHQKIIASRQRESPPAQEVPEPETREQGYYSGYSEDIEDIESREREIKWATSPPPKKGVFRRMWDWFFG